MKTFLKYLGAILVLCGVLCIVYYYFVAQTNVLLLVSIILEVIGVISFIVLNKYIE